MNEITSVAIPAFSGRKYSCMVWNGTKLRRFWFMLSPWPTFCSVPIT